MLGFGDWEQPLRIWSGNIYCRKGRARASVPDSEGSQLLPEDLGSGEPVSGLRPKIWDCILYCTSDELGVI